MPPRLHDHRGDGSNGEGRVRCRIEIGAEQVETPRRPPQPAGEIGGQQNALEQLRTAVMPRLGQQVGITERGNRTHALSTGQAIGIDETTAMMVRCVGYLPFEYTAMWSSNSQTSFRYSIAKPFQLRSVRSAALAKWDQAGNNYEIRQNLRSAVPRRIVLRGVVDGSRAECGSGG